MPRVNLVQERRKRERRQASTARILLVGCELLIIAMVAIFFTTTIAIYRRKAQINEAEGRLREIQARVEQVKSTEAQIDDLKPKLKLLQTAKDSTMHWYLVYQQTGQGLPTSSWLDNLAVNKTPLGAQSVVIAGESRNEGTVADAIRLLQQQPMFGQVNLHSVTQNNLPGPSLKGGPSPLHFELEIELKDSEGTNSAQPANKNNP
jgi:Tfp pilus assembly protein PilN